MTNEEFFKAQCYWSFNIANADGVLSSFKRIMSSGFLEYWRRVNIDARNYYTLKPIDDGANQMVFKLYAKHIEMKEKKLNELTGIPKDDPIIQAAFYIFLCAIGLALTGFGYERVKEHLTWTKVKLAGQLCWSNFKLSMRIVAIYSGAVVVLVCGIFVIGNLVILIIW